MPERQTVDRDGQQIDVVEAFEFGGAARQKWRKRLDALPKCRDALRFELTRRAFGYYIAALPVAAAIDEDENLAVIGPAKSLLWIAGRRGEPEPKNIHRSADFFWQESRLAADQRAAAVGADRQIRPDFEQTLRRFDFGAGDSVSFKDEADDLGAHF